jgi:hypothetical protein
MEISFARWLQIGLPVHWMPKVQNCGFSRPYHLDFIGERFRTNPMVLTLKNCGEIDGQVSKTAQLSLNARLGHLRPDR